MLVSSVPLSEMHDRSATNRDEGVELADDPKPGQ
jgi:hypothetical protein